SGAESSCRSHSQRVEGGRAARASRTAAPKFRAPGAGIRCQVSGASSGSCAPPSREASTSRTCAGARVCAARAARVVARYSVSPRVTTTAVTSTARAGGLRCVPGSDDTTLELAPLPLRESTPDAETFVVREGVLEALSAHLAALADPLRLAGRAALLGEEGLGVGLCAQRTILPAEHGVVLGRAEDRQDIAERGRRGLGLRRERAVRVEQIPH